MQARLLNPQQLAQAIRVHRKRLGLTQLDVAQRSGLLPKTISALENQPDTCRIESLFQLVAALDLNLGFLPKPAPRPSPKSEW